MAEYIECEATCEDCVHYGVCYHIEHYGRDIETDEPCKHFKSADVVEVVRCGQCRHATDDIIVEGVCYCHKIQQGMFVDGFCSYGERK